jgi:hypothetical protein
MLAYQDLCPLFGDGIVPAIQIDTIYYVAVFADDQGSKVSHGAHAPQAECCRFTRVAA